MDTALDFVTRFAGSAHVKLWAGAFLLGFLIELVLTAENGQPIRLRILNIVHALIYALVIFVTAPFVYGAVNQIAERLGGARIALGFFKSDNLAIQALGTIAYFIAIDFFYYWWHRAQHAVPLLWDQHAVHHSETALNVTTAVRHHWSEFAFQALLVTLPMLLLVDLTPTNHIVLASVFGFWQFFIHMNIRLHLGPLAPFIGAPQVHRIHHSIEPQHHDRNFAAYFPVWDALFGTYWHPKPGEYPATGLTTDKHETLLSLSFSPFVKWGRRARRAFVRRRPVDAG